MFDHISPSICNTYNSKIQYLLYGEFEMLHESIVTLLNLWYSNSFGPLNLTCPYETDHDKSQGTSVSFYCTVAAINITNQYSTVYKRPENRVHSRNSAIHKIMHCYLGPIVVHFLSTCDCLGFYTWVHRSLV